MRKLVTWLMMSLSHWELGCPSMQTCWAARLPKWTVLLQLSAVGAGTVLPWLQQTQELWQLQIGLGALYHDILSRSRRTGVRMSLPRLPWASAMARCAALHLGQMLWHQWQLLLCFCAAQRPPWSQHCP